MAAANDKKSADIAAALTAEQWAALVNEDFAEAKKPTKSAADFMIPAGLAAEMAKSWRPLSPEKEGPEDFWEWCPTAEGVCNGVRWRTPVVNVAKSSGNFGKKGDFFMSAFEDMGGGEIVIRDDTVATPPENAHAKPAKK